MLVYMFDPATGTMSQVEFKKVSDESYSREYSHPHPDPSHVMRCYRGCIVGMNRKKRRSARGLSHYKAYLFEYLAAKREVFKRRAIAQLNIQSAIAAAKALDLYGINEHFTK